MKLADALVYLATDDSKLKAGLGDAETRTRGWSDRMGGLVQGMAMGVGSKIADLAIGAVQNVGQVIGESAAAASDMGETVSKVETLFGSSAAGILAWADSSAQAFGLSKLAALDASGTLGNMFMQLGAGSDQAATTSQQMVGLAADIASFHNVAGGANEVLDAMTSAFRGEYDAVQRYIPTINAAAVQQQALAMTGKESAKELTSLEMAMAAQTLMAEGAGAALGDFGRTAEGAANQQRILEAQTENLKATIGQGLLPIQLAWTSALNEVVQRVLPPLANFIGNTVVPGMERMGAVIRSVVGAVIDWFGRLQVSTDQNTARFDYFRAWIDENMPRIQQIVETVLGALQTFWTNHGDAIMTVVDNTLSVVMTIFDTALKTILDLVTLALQLLTGDWEGAGQTLTGIVQRIWDTVRDVFRTQLDSIWTLVSDFDWAELGRNIVQGMIDGIVGMSAALWDAARRISEDLWDRMTGWWDTGSPSHKAEEGLGVPIAQGIGRGLQTGLDDIRAQIGGSMGGLFGALQPAPVAAGAAPIALNVYVSGADATYESGRAVGRGVLAELRSRGLA